MLPLRPGISWAVLGAAISAGAWHMDRLGSLNIEPWSAPGLVPGVLGLGMMLFGLGLALAPEGSQGQTKPDEEDPPLPWTRLLAVLGLCSIFGFIALGRIPFEAASAPLMFFWMLMLGWSKWPAGPARKRKVFQAAAISLVASFIISHLFQDIFLVRLP